MGVDLCIRNCRLLTPDGTSDGGAGVAVDGGTIAAVGRADSLPTADTVLDAENKLLAPGVIDCHIHNREPGLSYKEDWESATRAAAAGGVTTVVGMPNTDPIIDRPSHLETKYELGETSALVDFQSYAVVTAENIEEIGPLDDAGVLGYKVFLGTTVGDIPPPSDGQLLEAMDRIAETGKRLGFHEENDEIVAHRTAQFKAAGRNRPIDHAHSRPPIAETEAVSRTILFAEETGTKIHMFHVSSGSAAAVVSEGKSRGVDVTAETTPHYLWFTEDVLREKGNVARVQPPIRDAAERDGLWKQVEDGNGIDCIATDHAPHTDDEKGMDDPFANTWESISGFVGLETEVPAMLTFVNQSRLSLEQWIDMHSRRPAQIWDIYPQKGSLQVGTDADFTIVDPSDNWTLDDRHALHSKGTVTPFEGETFTGRVTTTIVRGTVVYDAEQGVVGQPGHGTRIDVSDD